MHECFVVLKDYDIRKVVHWQMLDTASRPVRAFQLMSSTLSVLLLHSASKMYFPPLSVISFQCR